MQIPGPLMKAEVLERENRFLVRVRLDGREVHAHMANPGRLPELIYPGAEVYVRPVDNPSRKTAFDTVLVRHKKRIYCSLDTRLANTIFFEALKHRRIPEFKGCTSIIPEFTHGSSRFDFCLKQGSQQTLVEVKSVSLVYRRHAFFPDAPTIRWQKHLRELAQITRNGGSAWVAFVCQRSDPLSVSPNLETDPDFGDAMEEAYEAGVRFMACGSRVTRREITITHRIPVKLGERVISTEDLL